MKVGTVLFRLLALMMLVGLVLGACSQTTATGTQPAEDVKPKEKVTVNVWWDIANEEDLKAYQKAFDKFNQSQDRIEAVIGKGQNNDAFLTAITGNNAPDLYITWSGSEVVGTWAHNGMLSSFDDYIARDNIDLNKYIKSAVDLGKYDGKYYGMPWQGDTILLFYNMNHFREAGLDPNNPPKNLDELVAAAEKLTQYDENGNITRMGLMPPTWFGPWYTQLAFYRPNMYDPDNKKVTLNTPEMRSAIADIKRLWDIYGDPAKADNFMSSLGNGLSPDDPFLTGQVSMVIDGDWRMGYQVRYTDNKYGEDFGVTTVPYPAGKENMVGASYYFGMLLVMPHNAPHKEEAWEFIKFMIDPETDVLVSQNMWNLPFTKAGLQDERLLSMPGFKVPLNNLLTNEKNMYNLPVFPATVKLLDELAAKIDLIVHNKAEIEPSLLEAQEAVQEELDSIINQ